MSLFLILLSTVFALVRFFRGPDWTDRIMVFDLLSSILILGGVVLSVQKNSLLVLSFVLALSFLSFISTIVFVFFLERSKESPNEFNI